MHFKIIAIRNIEYFDTEELLLVVENLVATKNLSTIFEGLSHIKSFITCLDPLLIKPILIKIASLTIIKGDGTHIEKYLELFAEDLDTPIAQLAIQAIASQILANSKQIYFNPVFNLFSLMLDPESQKSPSSYSNEDQVGPLAEIFPKLLKHAKNELGFVTLSAILWAVAAEGNSDHYAKLLKHQFGLDELVGPHVSASLYFTYIDLFRSREISGSVSHH